MKKEAKIIKYAALSFNTENIGDEIQSLAAQRFLPRIDYFIDRDNLDDHPQHNNETIKIILNSWFISPSIKDQLIHWPPKKTSLDPLLISMHVSFLNGSTDVFASSSSCSFLNSFSPVGARDFATRNFLQSLGIPTYFSGCLTLTLIPDPSIKKQNYILAVDISDKLFNELTQRSKRKIIRLDTTHPINIDTSTRFKLAKYWLYLYQSAHCVISPRLHAILPCLNLGTPVIGISGRDTERYSGLIELVNHYTEKELIQNKRISIDKPIKNPNTYKTIQKNLVKKCKEYTGYDSEQSFLLGTKLSDLLSDQDILSVFIKSVSDSYYYESEFKKHFSIEQQLEQELERLKNPGVKTSIKYLFKASKRYCHKNPINDQ